MLRRHLSAGAGVARLLGHVDRVDGLALLGWALDAEDPAARPLVQVVQDGVVVAATRPRLPTPQLRRSLGLAADGPPPLHGWQIALPLGSGVAPDRPFDLVLGEGQAPMEGGKGRIIQALGGIDQEAALDLAASPLTQISLSVQEEHVGIAARVLQTVPPRALQLTIGKGPPRRVTTRPLPPGSPFLRPGLLFESRLPRARIEAQPGFALPVRLRFPGDEAETRLNSHHALRATWLPRTLFDPSPPGGLPIPPVPLLRRIGGPSATPESYRIGGLTAFIQLDMLARRHAGRRLSRFPAVLDWGVGCARVLRHFAESAGPLGLPLREGQRLIGLDIDPPAIDWCRDTLAGVAEFGLLRGAGFDLPAGSIDLLYGISVMTHLTERDQQLWLAEIRRVLKPGGLAILTVHGEVAAALDMTGFAAGFVARFGFFDGIADRALGEEQVARYRTSFHARGYLRRVWGAMFEILDIVPAANGFLQDFVVLRKPG
jgi:SAM-dependent methyltransferase